MVFIEKEQTLFLMQARGTPISQTVVFRLIRIEQGGGGGGRSFQWNKDRKGREGRCVYRKTEKPLLPRKPGPGIMLEKLTRGSQEARKGEWQGEERESGGGGSREEEGDRVCVH